MASQNYLVIRLEPHYQQFLRCHFQCEAEIFEFPHRHRFNSVLEDLVARRPYGYVEPAVDDWTFRIALPTFNRKNSTHFRYLTKEMETIFKAKIKGYYDDIIMDELRDLLRRPEKEEGGKLIYFDRQECTQILIDMYNFNDHDKDAFDRLYKLYSRYKKNERNRKYTSKLKEKSKC